MVELLYLAAASMFIFGLKMLGSPRTARRGNMIAAAGMLLAILVTLINEEMLSWGIIVAGMVTGGAIGAVLALRVKMTAMPELVAAFNGFGGAASALVALAELDRNGAELPVEIAAVVAASLAVGSVTFSGSFIAFGKLQGALPGRPVALPGQHMINAVLAAGIIGLAVWGAAVGIVAPYWIIVAVALVLGVFGVLPIGGADMPVVISLLNSFSGLAAASAGFVLSNNLLIIGGALVGASGLILTQIMCTAMNRTLANVLFSGFGGAAASGDSRDYQNVRSYSAEEAAMVLESAESVIVIPGYGLAVAQAQHATRELGNLLEARGTRVQFAIHPVAGRMPGHMNVLLADADVPYEQLFEMDVINSEFKTTDAVLIVGANDVVNPAAELDPDSPIAGMPILKAYEAQSVMVIKRSLSPGFAGIKNTLFENDNTMMVFGDAKAILQALVSELKELNAA